MANIKEEFGSTTSLTITLTSLASSATAGRESTAVDNSTDKFIDGLLYVACKLVTGTPVNDQAIYVYAYASEDGTNYEETVTGTNGAITLRSPTNLVLIGRIEAATAGGLTYKRVFRLAEAFGGALPRKWGIVIRNYTGLALDTTGNAVSFTGIYYTST